MLNNILYITVPKPADTSESHHTISSTSESQNFPIHEDDPAVSKTQTTVTKATTLVPKASTTKSTSTPLRTIGPPEKKNPMNIYERKLRELKETLEEEVSVEIMLRL